MKSNIAKSLFAIVPAMLMMAASCGNSGSGDATGVEVPSEIKVGTAVLKMVNVEPTSFTSGIAPSGIKAKGATVRQVVLSGYSISDRSDFPGSLDSRNGLQPFFHAIS